MTFGFIYSRSFDYMKRFLISGLMVMAFTLLIPAQAQTYVVEGSVISPPDVKPQIDAPNFLNPDGGYFEVTIPVESWTSQVNDYSMTHTLNFTNRGKMTFNPGFNYEYVPRNYVAV